MVRAAFRPRGWSWALLLASLALCNLVQAEFVRGDANNDAIVDISDPIQTFAFLFTGGSAVCMDAVDSNDDGLVDIADAVTTLAYLFSGAAPLPAPFPNCGTDPTPDALGCATPPAGCTPLPEITSQPNTLANVDTLYLYDVQVALGSGPVTFALDLGPTGATIQSTTGVVDWLPTELDVGIHDFVVRATNGGGFDEQAFTVTVNPWPGAPLLNAFQGLTPLAQIMLVGTAPGAATVEFVNDDQVITTSAGPGGSFAQLVPLNVNETNLIHVRGRNAAGQVSAPTTAIVIQDSQPPELFIDNPVNGSTTFDPAIDVLGRVSDMLSGFMGMVVTVSVNGGPVQPADVNEGIGTNGTFFASPISLALGMNTIEATVLDAVGNSSSAQVQVERLELDPAVPTLTRISGNDQTAAVNTDVDQPLVVQVTDMNGAPFANKLVNFRVTRSDGRVRSPGAPPEDGAMLFQAFTDASGMANAAWQLGTDAGAGNQRVRVTSVGIQNPVLFCASAAAGPPVQLNIGAGNNQRGEAGMPAECVLCAWVSDGCNGVGGVPVTFTVTRGNGKVNGQSEVTIFSDPTGHAELTFIYGTEPGNNFVSANTASNTGSPAVFNMFGVARDPLAPTSFSGLVLSNSSQPIVGATCTLEVPGQPPLVTMTSADGRFEFPMVTGDGASELTIDAATATAVGGRAVPAGSFPYLYFEPIIVPNAANSLPMPVLIPELNPNNLRSYSTTLPTELSVEGIEGLKMIVAPGSMTLPNGMPAPDGTPVSLNIVHHDDVPMPMPDGASPPFAWTLQPAEATFNPPVALEYPNVTGLSAGSIANILTFSHETGKFEIFGTGSVSDDGATIVTDAGSGLTLAGWGGICPPYSTRGSFEQWECDCSRLTDEFETLIAVAAGFAALPPFFPSYASIHLLHFLFGDGSDKVYQEGDAMVDWIRDHPNFFVVESFVVQQIESAVAAAAPGATRVSGFPLSHPGISLYPPPISFPANPNCQQKLPCWQLAAAIGGFSETIQIQVSDLVLTQGTYHGIVEYEMVDHYAFGVSDCGLSGYDAMACCIQNCGLANPFYTRVSFSDPVEVGGPKSRTSSVELNLVLGPDYFLGPPLDESFLVLAGDSQAWANAAGTFRVSNISAIDNFGPTGPGSPPDQVGDDFVRIVAVSTVGESPLYAFSTGRRVVGGEVTESSPLVFTSTAPLLPESLRFDPPGLLAVEPESMTQLSVKAALGDGSEEDVTATSDWTTYRSSSAAVATVDASGVLIAGAAGQAFVSASNGGAATVRRVAVVPDIVITEVVGFLLLPSGAPAGGIGVTSDLGGGGTSGRDGSFSFEVSVPAGTEGLAVWAAGEFGGVSVSGASGTVEIVVEGYSDAGVVDLRYNGVEPLFPAEMFPMTGQPQAIELRDLNQDGLLDLVAGGSGVDVRLGLGGGTFGGHRSYPGGNYGLASGDIDGDGAVDLVTLLDNSTGSDRLLVHFGLGNGDFVQGPSVIVGAGPREVVLGDINDDGWLDAVTGNSIGDSFSVLLGDGSGSLGASQEVVIGEPVNALGLRDLNGDQQLDLVLLTGFSTLRTYLGNGTGGFTPAQIYDISGVGGSVGAQFFSMVDVNLDGEVDVATANYADSSVSVLLGQPGGAFVLSQHYPVSFDPRGLATGDLDGDGAPEIVCVSSQGLSLDVLENDGSGNFALAATYYVDKCRRVAIADVTEDGVLDVVTANRPSSGSGYWTVLHGRGDGSLAVPLISDVGSEPWGLASSDLDGDSNRDLVVVNSSNSGNLRILLGAGTGDFSLGQTTSVAEACTPACIRTDLVIGDIDGDGLQDVVSANVHTGSVSLLHGQPAGTLGAVEVHVLDPVGLVYDVAVGDLNQDGLQDIAGATSSSLAILLSILGGGFGAPTSIPVPECRGVSVADLNGDGILDVISTSTFSDTLSVWLGLGGGALSMPQTFAIGDGPVDSEVFDLNGDGALDVVTANRDAHEISVLLGLGDGTFTTTLGIAVGETQDALAVADVDGDGPVDLVFVVSDRSRIGFVRGKGDGSFDPPRWFASGGKAPRKVVLQDLDADGDIDIAVTNGDSDSVGVSLGLRIR